MKEELQEQILSIVENGKEGILRSIEIAQQQAPKIIHQLLMWELTMSLMGIALGITLIVPFVVWVKLKKRNNRLRDMDEVDSFIFWIFTSVVGIVGIGVSIGNLLKALKILMIPNVYLVGYFTRLIH